MFPKAEINTGISDTVSLLDIQEALAYLMRYSFGVYQSAEFIQNRKEIPAAFLAPSLHFFFPPIKVETHFWWMHGQIVVLIRRVILPGRVFAGVAGELLLLKPRCSSAGFRGAIGIQAQGPLPTEGQEVWGTPWVLCPLARHMVVVLVQLVAGMAAVLLALLKVSACFNVSLKRVGLRHQQQ